MPRPKKTKVGCRVTEEQFLRIKQLADKENWSMSKVTEIAVEYYLKVRGIK